MAKSRALKGGALFIFIGILSFFVTHWVVQRTRSEHYLTVESQTGLTKDKLSQALREIAVKAEFPPEKDFSVRTNEVVRGKIQYTFDSELQQIMKQLIESYKPDHGAFVAMDPTTGRILSMVSYSRDKLDEGNLTLRASFPSASVFKVVTAAAAIEQHQISGNTVIPFNGRNHTLYRTQILKSSITRWTRFITLREAFARSVNTVFGKIGAFTVGPVGLRLYADRFGFNRKISADIPIQEGKALIPDDSWGLAESASGFTRENKMSPLQGALIAASVANGGVMMEPFIVQSVVQTSGPLEGASLYSARPKVANVAMDPATANEIRGLMKETVLHGTSRGSFRGFFRKDLVGLDVGGKTGSLTGYEPPGKYDWFVGYADSGKKRIAVAALTIHEKQWRVKSSYLARRAIETYFREEPHQESIAKK